MLALVSLAGVWVVSLLIVAYAVCTAASNDE